MQDFLKTVDGLPTLVKIILCIPVVNIFYSICRIIQGVVKNDALWIVLGIISIPLCEIWWIADLIWVILKGHATLLGDTYLG